MVKSALRGKMFTGHYVNSIDNKGRVSIPSQFRKILNAKSFNSIHITKHEDGCLCAYPPDVWQETLDTVSKFPRRKVGIKSFRRFVFSSAIECPIDKLGRILIPQELREYAQIKKEVLFAGIGKEIEIWSRELWDKALEEAKEILQNNDIFTELGL